MRIGMSERVKVYGPDFGYKYAEPTTAGKVTGNRPEFN